MSNNWVGTKSTAWATASNWSSGAVPDASDDVVIPGGTTNEPTISATEGPIASLTLDTGATLKFTGSHTLTVTGAVTNGGTITLDTSTLDAGTVTNNNLITITTGTLSTTGALTNSNSITITKGTLSVTGTLTNSSLITVAGGTVTGGSIANTGTISGSGTLAGTLTGSGAATVTASGGTLIVSGAASGNAFTIGTASASTLEFTNTVAAAAISMTVANQTLLIGTGGVLTLTGAQTLTGGTLSMAGGSINDSLGIVLSGGKLTGYGTVGADLTQSGTASTVTSSGGTLNFTGGVTGTGITFAIGNSSTLEFSSAATAVASPTMTGTSQILAVNSGGSLNLTTELKLTGTGAKIVMAGGSLTDGSGISLGASATLSGNGTVNAAITGAGTLTATNGTLSIIGAVDASGVASTLQISSGATLTLSAAVGTGSINPVLNFLDTSGANATGTFTDTGVAMTSVDLGTISTFTGMDVINLMAFGAGDTITYGTDTITIKNAAGTLSKLFTFSAATSAIKLSDTGGVDTLTICFMAGTMIRTPAGETAVETLRRGDLVLTADGAVMPVTWLGRQTIAKRFADPLRSWPIRIKAGALADNMPSRDLLLSPDHALLVDGLLIQTHALINGTSILREDAAAVPEIYVFYHVELDDHALVLAENTPAETFVDNVDRLAFDNWDEHLELYPNGKAIKEMPYPRAKSQRQVPVRTRIKLAERALGFGRQGSAAVA